MKFIQSAFVNWKTTLAGIAALLIALGAFGPYVFVIIPHKYFMRLSKTEASGSVLIFPGAQGSLQQLLIL